MELNYTPDELKTILDRLEDVHVSAVKTMYDGIRIYFASRPDDIELLRNLVKTDISEAMTKCKEIVADLYVASALASLTDSLDSEK